VIIEIEKRLRTLADKDIAKKSARFVKNQEGDYGAGDAFLGIRLPTIRKLVKEYNYIPPEQTFEILNSRYNEQRQFALLMLVRIFEKAETTERKYIYDQYLKHTQHINNWNLVDSSAMQIVGGYLYGSDTSVLYTLAKSSSLWERRISIISTFCFIKNNEFDDTLKLAKLLLNDTEDLIHKATGWMLREVGNRDRAREEVFLKQHYKAMPRTMLRYAIEKFPETLRKKYLLGKF
jgi:3-methyladenine DNA glycosylase AlkD